MTPLTSKRFTDYLFIRDDNIVPRVSHVHGGQEMKLGFKGKSPGNEVGKMRDRENEAGQSNIFRQSFPSSPFWEGFRKQCGNAC